MSHARDDFETSPTSAFPATAPRAPCGELQSVPPVILQLSRSLRQLLPNTRVGSIVQSPHYRCEGRGREIMQTPNYFFLFRGELDPTRGDT